MNWKHWLYIVYIVLAALVSAGLLSSCSLYHDTDCKGYTRIVTTDTTLINHVGIYKVSR